MNRDRIGQGEAATGIAASIEANEMAGHNVLTRDASPPVISALGAIDDSGAVVALKRAVDGTDRNLPLHQHQLHQHQLHQHQREILTHRDALNIETNSPSLSNALWASVTNATGPSCSRR